MERLNYGEMLVFRNRFGFFYIDFITYFFCIACIVSLKFFSYLVIFLIFFMLHKTSNFDDDSILHFVGNDNTRENSASFFYDILFCFCTIHIFISCFLTLFLLERYLFLNLCPL